MLDLLVAETTIFAIAVFNLSFLGKGNTFFLFEVAFIEIY